MLSTNRIIFKSCDWHSRSCWRVLGDVYLLPKTATNSVGLARVPRSGGPDDWSSQTFKSSCTSKDNSEMARKFYFFCWMWQHTKRDQLDRCSTGPSVDGTPAGWWSISMENDFLTMEPTKHLNQRWNGNDTILPWRWETSPHEPVLRCWVDCRSIPQSFGPSVVNLNLKRTGCGIRLDFTVSHLELH